MSYSPLLGSSFNRTKLRDPQHVSTFSGMCSMCTADCVGTCEIGISAVRGALTQTVNMSIIQHLMQE